MYCNVAPATCVYAALADNVLIAAPVAGYTFILVAEELVIKTTIPATAVGNLTPCPALTVETKLSSLVNAVAFD